jgi:hypothetical protein
MIRLDQMALPVVLLGLLAMVCLACDFLMAPALAMPWPLPGLPILLAIVGCVLAQGCLLAAWLAWSDQPFWRRFRRHWIVAAILYLVWAAGLAISHPSQFLVAFSAVGLSVPLVSLAAQLPLWIARQMFGWRLIRGDAHDDAGPAPLSIRDLLTATFVIALTLALDRLAPSPDGQERGLIPLFTFIVASAVSTVTLLPAAPLLLRIQPFRRGLLFAGVYAAFWLGLLGLFVLVARYSGLFRLPPHPIPTGVACFILSFAATVMLAGAAARTRGYRLVWGRRPRRSSGF